MKKVDKTINYSCYRYAPEMFKLSILGKQCKVHNPSEYGYKLITGKQEELTADIKRFIRKNTSLRKTCRYTLAVYVTEKDFVFIRELPLINPYDIKEKLQVYQQIIESIKSNPIVTKGTMVEYGKFSKGDIEYYQPLNRVKLIAI